MEGVQGLEKGRWQAPPPPGWGVHLKKYPVLGPVKNLTQTPMVQIWGQHGGWCSENTSFSLILVGDFSTLDFPFPNFFAVVYGEGYSKRGKSIGP